jgi:hypothetical protein
MDGVVRRRQHYRTSNQHWAGRRDSQPNCQRNPQLPAQLPQFEKVSCGTSACNYRIVSPPGYGPGWAPPRKWIFAALAIQGRAPDGFTTDFCGGESYFSVLPAE